ncbi:MAG: toxin-antitoxin system YwqK family antitoxin [Vicinamibacterales bacterium]
MRKKSSARPLRPGYRSSIPARARARITHRHASTAPERIDYLVGRSVVGCRHFDANGGLLFDYGIRRGRRHGREYRWDEPGTLVSATAYRNGLEHGLARQWSPDGRIIGTYRMRNGTGIDLWWQETWTKPRRPYLSEVRFMKNGQRHGFEWWANDDQRSVYQERHWSMDDLHGIEREWNDRGTLRSGFPRFYVRGRRVTRRAYDREQKRNASLPAYKPEDDLPQRDRHPVLGRLLRLSARRMR